MSQKLHLTATVRKTIGKNANRKLRAKGVIPAVFYTPDGKNTPVQVQEAALMRLYSTAGRTSIFQLEIDDDGKKSTTPCLIWDVEYYPTKYRFQHVDFYGVDMDKELKIRVPLEFKGVSKGVKAGGKMETFRDHIEILSKAATLPKRIVVDVTELAIDQGLRVADLIMPEGVRAFYDENFAIVSVNIPSGSSDQDDEEGNDE